MLGEKLHGQLLKLCYVLAAICCCEPQGQMALCLNLSSVAHELHGLFMHSFLLSPGFLISKAWVNHLLCQGWV